MSEKKIFDKLQQGQSYVQQGKETTDLLGGGRKDLADKLTRRIADKEILARLKQRQSGVSQGNPVSGLPGSIGNAITGGGFAGGLAQKAASGHSAATKALQKASQMLSGGNAPSGLQFTLTAGGLAPQTFVVTDFTLSEHFSQPFQLEVGLASADPAIDFPAVLDRSATLTITQDGVESRSITGMVTRFEQGNTGLHQTPYQMSIRPDLWRTTLRQNSRIFQQLNIAAIITTILKEHGIRDVVFSLRHAHPEREFCVQYQESDFAFLQRLTAEEGIFYFFECGGGRNTLVFADDAGSVPPGIVIPYQPGDASTVGEPAVSSLTHRAQVRPAQVQLKDYTFKNPAWPAEFSQQMKEDTLQQMYYEHYDYPGRFKDEAHGKDFTRYRLEALRNDAITGQGRGHAIAIQPGRLFTLYNHPREELNQPWQVVSASHTGSQPQALETASGDSGTTLHSQFSFIRHNQSWRPAPLPKPVIDGPQIAKVVGPAGEEIFCDPYGRIRLQFPWDRYGKSDDQSSCWIRVTQPWAGQGWGMLAIPRIGQEVVVDFLHGDPDQPIVTGRTYHASNIPPGALPGSKTQMAFRSKTHKGEGYNELLFEDAKGSERLSLHAQKDMHTTVKDNQSLVVEAGDRTLTIQTGDEVKTVQQGNLTETICRTRSTEANVIQVKAKAGKAGAGTQLYQAQDNITLQVGPGSIEMTPEHIRIAFGSSAILLTNAGIFVDGASIGLNNGSAGTGLPAVADDMGNGSSTTTDAGQSVSSIAKMAAPRPSSTPTSNSAGRQTMPAGSQVAAPAAPSPASAKTASTTKTDKTMGQDGLDLLKGIESLRLKPYDDQTGKTITKWTKGATIGYGKLILEKEWNTYKDGITEDKAEELFKETLSPFEKAVNSAITKEISQNKFDALVMLAYNIGESAFNKSSVVTMVNDENAKTSYSTLDDAWNAWNKSQGKVNQGLINRRSAELKIYNEGVYERW